jgi:hypothetical protein
MTYVGTRIGLLGVLLALLTLFSACSTSHHTTKTTRTSGQSAVREQVPVPSSGPAANQAAWQQGQVPKELQKMPSATSQPPVPGQNTYTSTTAPTGETRTMPKQQTSSTNHPTSSGYSPSRNP